MTLPTLIASRKCQIFKLLRELRHIRELVPSLSASRVLEPLDIGLKTQILRDWDKIVRVNPRWSDNYLPRISSISQATNVDSHPPQGLCESQSQLGQKTGSEAVSYTHLTLPTTPYV